MTTAKEKASWLLQWVEEVEEVEEAEEVEDVLRYSLVLVQNHRLLYYCM